MMESKRLSFYRPVQQGAIIAICALAIGCACAALYTARMIFLTLLIGLGLGIVVRPVVKWLRARGKFVSRLSIPIVLVGLLAVFFGFSMLLYILTSNQLVPLSKKMPGYLQSLEGRFEALSSHYHFIAPEHVTQGMGANLENAARTVFSALNVSAGLAADLFFVLAVCLYFASSPEEYFEGFLSLLPARRRPVFAKVMKECATSVRNWFTSQSIAMVIVGTLLAVALRVIGHQYWFLLGIITGFLELVPFLGPVTALAVGALITLAAEPDKIVVVLVIYFVLLQLEGNVIIPLLMRGRVKLPPIYLLTTMLVFAEWFGVLGLLVATPILTVVRTILVGVYIPKMNEMKRPLKPRSLAA